MDAGGSSTCVCMFTSRAFARVNAAKCAEKERERGGEEALESLSVSQEHGPERETRLSVCIVHLQKYLEGSQYHGRPPCFHSCRYNESFDHPCSLQTSSNPLDGRGFLYFILFGSRFSLGGCFLLLQIANFEEDRRISCIFTYSYIGGKIRIWFRRISFMDYTFRVFCVSVTRTFYFYIFIFVSISHLSSINYSHSSMHNNDDIY